MKLFIVGLATPSRFLKPFLKIFNLRKLSCSQGLLEEKTILGAKEAVAAATELIAGVLVSPNALLRYAAADCMGRLAQVVGDHKVITEMAQKSFDFLKSARDVASRTGHSFALGCLHRFVKNFCDWPPEE